MIDVEVIDDFLDQPYIDFIEHWAFNNAKWYYRPNISSYLMNFPSTPWHHGLSLNVHEPVKNVTFENSGTGFMVPFVLKVEETFGLNITKSCHRARFDMTLISPPNSMHEPHVDFDHPHYACILYVNDSDGDTVIYNETTMGQPFTEKCRISPKKNRLVFFNGSYYHTGHSPSEYQNRILVNSNYFIPE